MKFGKEFKKQKVPEWTEAYMDYNGLKRVLGEVVQYKASVGQPSSGTPLGALQRAFSGLNSRSDDPSRRWDVEDHVIDVNLSTPDQGCPGERYKTEFLGGYGDGVELEVKFFRKLDGELNKVNAFYAEKVEEVVREASLLDRQMDAFVALRIKVRRSGRKATGWNTSKAEAIGSTRGTGAADVKLAAEMSKHSRTEQGVGGRGKSEQESVVAIGTVDDYDSEDSISSTETSEIRPTHSGYDRRDESVQFSEEDLLKILDHVKINNNLESPLSTIKGVFKDSKEEELRFKEEEVRRVEEQLRAALIEFYQKLRLLKHFSYMNLAAFSKIMKKYEKITSRRAARCYIETVDNSFLGSSDEVSGLLERVEDTFIKHFSNANRREGMKSLRPKSKREKHRVTFYSGFFSGCSVALVIAIVLLIETRKLMDKGEGASYMINIFPLYSVFGFVILHMLMYAVDIYFWRRYKVNYPFIFGFKQGTELGYREVFLLSTGLAVLALASFLANIHLDLDSNSNSYKTVTELLPLGLILIFLAILFCPIDIIYRSSRFFFIRCLLHCISAPLYKVTLPDFFLADHLTSQVQTIRCLELYICYYSLGEYSRRQNKCHSHGTYNAFYFVVAVIPYLIRLLQCLRRWWEEKDPMHGYNGLKYLLTIIAVLIRTAFELKQGKTWMVLALLSSGIAVMMNTYWDLVVDWGLLRRKSKNPFLRDKLVISHKSVYFIAMVINVLLRLAWMQLVLEFNLHSLHKMSAGTIVSCLEIIRRGMWSFFRLENEHLNNVGKYRAFKSVPLPFNYYDPDPDKDD